MTNLSKMESVHQVSRVHPHVALTRDILSYYGYEMTQEMAYGLCMGIGFEYINKENYAITNDYVTSNPYFGGYFSMDRRKIAKNLRIWLDIYRFQDKDTEKGFQYIYNYLRMGRPIIAEVDIAEYKGCLEKLSIPDLDMGRYDVKEHMYVNGYDIIVIGFDEENNHIIFLDPYIKQPLKMHRDTFDSICYTHKKYIQLEGERSLIVVPRHKNVINIDIAIVESIRNSIYEYRNPYFIDEHYVLGDKALNRIVKELPEWNQTMDAKQRRDTVDFLYFNSEMVVKHSGLYRKCYSEFLKEASVLTGNEKLNEVSCEYEQLGSMWSELIGRMKELADKEAWDSVWLEQKLRKIQIKENKAMDKLEEAVSSQPKKEGI